jgi:hypothetical protein
MIYYKPHNNMDVHHYRQEYDSQEYCGGWKTSYKNYTSMNNFHFVYHDVYDEM